MPFSHLKLSLHFLPINHVPNTPFSPIFYHMAHSPKFQASTNKSSYQVSLVKNNCSSFCQISPTKLHASPASSIVDTEDTSDLWEWYEQKFGIVPSERKTSTKGVQVDSSSNSVETYTDDNQKESDRRRKIGLANKGKVPWNKGKKHTTETRERIRQRTKEAMMDPKVKKKILECPRAHSDQTKERIGTALKRLWGEKLKWKRSRAKFLSIWAESIAEAGKKGGIDQQELNWNSYDKMKEEIAIQQRRWAADRAEAKEMAKVEAAQKRAEKMARLAQKRKEQGQRAKARGEIKRKTQRKSKEEREESAIAQGLKLKERLTKIHRKKIPTNGQITREDKRTWERLDVEFIKGECRRREVSLADQIRAAKTKRVELVARESVATSGSLYSSSEKSAA